MPLSTYEGTNLIHSGTVTSIERIEETQTMYNLTVDTAHTFFVGEGKWLVHNTNTSACSSYQYQQLKLLLGKTEASDIQVIEALANTPGRPIAGAGANSAFRDAQNYVNLYGGNVNDWGKFSTHHFTAPDGAQFEIHYVMNTATQQIVDLKTKILKGIDGEPWLP